MISAIAWVPAGVADPEPKRYELSAAERNMLQAMEEQENEANAVAAAESSTGKPAKERRKRGTMKVQIPPSAAASGLPADLRMDEYSSDEDEGAALGRLLVDQPGSLSDDAAGEQKDDEIERQNARNLRVGKKAGSARNFDEEDDDDDEDNLDDVPDTREYTPIDVDGLDAMGLYNVGLGAGADEEDMDFDEDESEAEDVKLSEDDAIILVTKTEDDFSALEVHVYDQKRGTLYVHHDIPLPSFPLCVAHGQVSCEGTAGNFCAVGTFDTGIEIWNLDVLNALEPSCILGGEDAASRDMMKQQLKGRGGGAAVSNMGLSPSGLRPGSHTDAVMAVSWNSIHKQVVASGSADNTVKLWDVTQAGYDASGKPNATTFDHHRGKVQSVVWHPKEGTLLATGSYDKSVALLDARSSSAEHVKSVKIPSDCEVLAWDPFHPEHLTVGTEDGTISCWDVRKFETSTPLWTLVANEFGGISDLTYSPHVPGLLATCSVDKTVTLWDSYHNQAPAENMAPRPCGSKDMCAGKLYNVAFYESTPLLLACGGSGNILSLWNLEDEEAVKRNFAARIESGGTEHTGEALEPNKADLEAMMAERAARPEPEKKSKKKGKSKKGKRKAHKKGSS